MDLRFTPEQQAFRAEVREWLHAHVPRERLASYDTREGFEQHLILRAVGPDGIENLFPIRLRRVPVSLCDLSHIHQSSSNSQ